MIVAYPKLRRKSRSRSARASYEHRSQHFRATKQTYHTNEQPRLLRGTTDTGVTDDSDGESSGETGETDRQTGTELDESSVEGHGRLHWADRGTLAWGSVGNGERRLTITGDQDGDDETVLSRIGLAMQRRERDPCDHGEIHRNDVFRSSGQASISKHHTLFQMPGCIWMLQIGSS